MDLNEKVADKKRAPASISWKFLFSLIALAAIALLFVVSVFYHGASNVETFKSLGPWGDFAAGLLNPVLTFLSFIGVLVTIVLQRIELSESRLELERSADALEAQIRSINLQSFESTFFQMLSVHNSIVNSIDLVSSETSVTTNGRDCFRVFYTRLTKIYRDNEKKGQPKHGPSKILDVSYRVFWKDSQLELGHYFRFLYNFFRLIDESAEARPYHAKLIRSQLSDQELLILFYNCTSDQGKNFRKYAVKYEIFDNLPTVRLLHPTHADLIDRAAFGQNPMLTGRDVRMPNQERG
ncbi:hypothetical protein B0A89_05335 [Paracoccus contaminans]|uniref:Phage abortive infection protein n=1 Tax=Paracoccus contaminans TaxID=1945662 RepID=A0A1W6CWB0_9RHOB|nr:hypothetical protein B0A89_05335 [Paracoccus contaminans]